MTRGLRNNNPLNIRRVAGQHWKGEILPLEGAGGSAFVQFSSLDWGIRAAFVLLSTYSTKYHANCIRDIISRWAPPTENDTERYIRNVCFWTGYGGLQRLTEQDWPRLIGAMARQECGEVLSEDIINRGYELYKTNNHEK